MPDQTPPKQRAFPGTPERFVRIYLMLATLSALFVLALNYYVLDTHNKRNLRRDAELGAVKIANAISRHEFDTICFTQTEEQSTIVVDPKRINLLHENLSLFMTSFNIRKIKIYDRAMRIVYSNDTSLIGRIDAHNRLLQRALSGLPQSYVKPAAERGDLAQERSFTNEVAKIYVPIYDDRRQVAGVFELYTDVSDLKHELNEHLYSSLLAIIISLIPLLLVSYVVVRKETNELRAAHRLLATIAATDTLTGVANRYHLLKQADEHFALLRRKRGKLPKETGMGLVMVDVDHFKQVNDRYGHQVGDEVLALVAHRLTHAVRTYDVIGRYGGEEFLVVLPQAAESEVLEVARRVNQIVAEHPVELEGLTLTVTVSVGYSWTNAQEELDVALRRADQGLYAAKQRGRNRVGSWLEGEQETEEEEELHP